MADDGEVVDSEVRVVELADEQVVDDGVFVPKGEPLPAAPPAEPPPGQIVDVAPPPDGELRVLEPEPVAPVDDGTSNTILVPEAPPPPAAPDGGNGGDDAARDPAPPPTADDGTSNTILFPEEPPPPAAEPPDPHVPVDVHEPPAPHAPADVHEPAPAPAHELPTDLFDAPPAFATGAGPADAPPEVDDPGTVAAESEPVEAESGATAPTATVDEPVAPPEPLEVVAEGDEDDPSFLERVADAVGDLWDDTTDAVT